MKAGAQRLAAELGIALLMPDTSPRGAGVPGEAESWDFGVGAGFYLDATREPWARHWRMESYLMHELLPLAVEAFPIDAVAHRHLRPFDGRPRCADPRDATSMAASHRFRRLRRSQPRRARRGARKRSAATSATTLNVGSNTMPAC